MMKKLIIKNTKKEPLWYKMNCTCKKDNVMESFPVKECLHCSYVMKEESIPKEQFIITNPKGKKKLITQITLLRGRHEEVIAWSMI